MAFINPGDMVTVKAGRWAGRWGRLAQLRIEDVTGEVYAFVDLVEAGAASSRIFMFMPEELERRRMNAAQLEREEMFFAAIEAERMGAEA